MPGIGAQVNDVLLPTTGFARSAQIVRLHGGGVDADVGEVIATPIGRVDPVPIVEVGVAGRNGNLLLDGAGLVVSPAQPGRPRVLFA